MKHIKPLSTFNHSQVHHISLPLHTHITQQNQSTIATKKQDVQICMVHALQRPSPHPKPSSLDLKQMQNSKEIPTLMSSYRTCCKRTRWVNKT